MPGPLKVVVLEILNEALLSHGHFDDPDVADAVTKLIRSIDADLDGLGYEPSDVTSTGASDVEDAILTADSKQDEERENDEPKAEDEPPAAKDF